MSHTSARQVMRSAFQLALGRQARAAEMQYSQAVALKESGYGSGWKDACVGSNNWGAVQCSGSDCCEYEDSYPDGTRYTVSFKVYPSPEEGAADVVRHVIVLRPRTASVLASGNPTIMRASLAMRREKYYGGWCPGATAQYGGGAAQQSFANPDASAATRACEREAVQMHAKGIQVAIAEIAAELGEPISMPLGTFDDAFAWWHGGGSRVSSGAAVGLAVVGIGLIAYGISQL